MTMNEPNWDLYRSFLSVLTEGSLSGAARALGLTQPTVGRHIDALEQSLALSLFTRSQSGFIPTDAAYALQSYAETLAATSSALLRAASGLGHGEIKGTVRVTASETISVEVLPPILARLTRAHPGITIELATSNRIENLLRRDADIAVRMTRPEQDVLVARRIGNIDLGFHARRDYLKRRGTPNTWDDMAGHALIGIDRETAFTRSLQHLLGNLQNRSYALRSDSDLVHLASIRAGLGIGICQVGLAKHDARLVRVLPDLLTIPLDTWLAMHENLRSNPACATTFAALAEGLTEYVNGAG
ncbi:LysR family transcriptional regulator [Duganella sp. BJB488]|uniref:LysR family transcriptional regulator n=1 Tax=unclassified Duganella TaxID=2636909 RepID=UPI000E34D60D|nr:MULTISPECIES: LysR family transcriptional regulator [unclassified Duganella]RFP11073.1 LysR family transcriptional regulator [Duganella sp. BJB489]RFP14379.1 LysR family transcriptional regulator [Duganella sp. BJB488]RFP30314.1 LysR family transcriptional regulator [Duganella sp. BJB480]